MSAYKKTIILGLDTSEYITGIKETKEANEGLKESMEGTAEATEKLSEATEDCQNSTQDLGEKLGGAITNLATGSAALLATGAAVKSLMTDTAEFGKELTTLSTQTGIGVETLQQLQYAAEQLGISSDTMMDSISGMTETMDKARDGSEELQAAFHTLGVKYTEHGNQLRDAQSVYVEIIESLSQISNEEERAALATDIFGSSAKELTPLFEAGTQGLSQLMQQASEYGVVVSEDAVAASAEFAASMESLDEKFEAVKVQLGTALMPIVEKACEILLKIPTPLYEIAAALALVVTAVVGITKITKAISDLASMLNTVNANAMVTRTQILIIIAALTALGAIIAVIIGQSAQLDSAMESVRSVTGTTQYNATGTDFFTGGETWVGENGPELVTLPRGSRITPASDSVTGSTNIYNVTIDAKNVREFNDIVKLAQHEQTSYRVGTVRI